MISPGDCYYDNIKEIIKSGDADNPRSKDGRDLFTTLINDFVSAYSSGRTHIENSTRKKGKGVVAHLGFGLCNDQKNYYYAYASYLLQAVNIEHVTGTPYDDQLTGSDTGNDLNGMGGEDTLNGADTMTIRAWQCRR